MKLVGVYPRQGYRKKNTALVDLIACGLISYNTPTTDKVGKSSRTAVRGKALVNTGPSYIKYVPFANLPLTYIDNTTKLEVISAFDALGEFIIPTNGVARITVDFSGEPHIANFESRQDDGLIPFNNSGEPILVEQFLSEAIPTINSNIGSLQDESGEGVTFADGSQYFDSALTLQIDVGTPILGNNAYTSAGRITPTHVGRIKHDKRVVDGVVLGESNADDFYNHLGRLTITVNESNDIQYGGYSGTCGFQDPTPITLKANTNYTFVVNGYTDTPYATGAALNVIGLSETENTNLVDHAKIWFETTQTEQRALVNVPVETIVYVGGRPGLSTDDTFANYLLYEGNHLTGSLPTGFESGNSITPDQVYDGEKQYDTNNILYTGDVPNVLTFDDLANITGLQLFVSEDKQKLLFFEEPLTEGSECLYKALKAINGNEGYYVQTTESSGEYESYNVAEGPYYVVKDWVVIE